MLRPMWRNCYFYSLYNFCSVIILWESRSLGVTAQTGANSPGSVNINIGGSSIASGTKGTSVVAANIAALPVSPEGYPMKTVIYGQRVALDCNAVKISSPVWYKGRVDVRTLPYYGKRMNISGDTLLLSRAVKEDMDCYTCGSITGQKMREGSRTYFLNVTYLPFVLDNLLPDQTVWLQDNPGALDCPVDANPPLTSTVWKKGEHDIKPTGRFHILPNGTLTVSAVKLQDGANYSCEPRSALGNGRRSKFIHVVVRFVLDIDLRPQDLYEAEVGQALTMPCSVTGSPAPIITWRKDKKLIDLSTTRVTQMGGNLTIKSVVKTDQGKYECVANSTTGIAFFPTEVKITEKEEESLINRLKRTIAEDSATVAAVIGVLILLIACIAVCCIYRKLQSEKRHRDHMLHNELDKSISVETDVDIPYTASPFVQEIIHGHEFSHPVDPRTSILRASMGPSQTISTLSPDLQAATLPSLLNESTSFDPKKTPEASSGGRSITNGGGVGGGVVAAAVGVGSGNVGGGSVVVGGSGGDGAGEGVVGGGANNGGGGIGGVGRGADGSIGGGGGTVSGAFVAGGGVGERDNTTDLRETRL